MGLEREHKWLVKIFPDVAGLEKAFAAVAAEMRYTAERSQHDTYFDTPERQLQGAGAALRVRRFGTETLATYKGPGTVVDSLHTREEIEVPFVEPPFVKLPAVDTWPEAIGAKLVSLGVVATRLEPILDLHTARTRYLLYGSDTSTPLAELSFDEVRAGSREHHGERRVQFRELELEAQTDTTDATLAQLGAVLTTFDIKPHDSDKLTHALSLLGL